MMELRKVKDIKEIKQLHKQIFESEFPEQDFFKKLKTRVLDIYLFDQDKTTIGYSIVYNQKKERNYHLWLGGILPSFQGKGYHGQFLDKMVGIAGLNEYKTLTVASYNHRPNMLRLVIKKGFKIIGTEEGSYGDKIKIKFKYFITAKNEIRISLTNVCNFKCFFCHNEGLDAESPATLSNNKLEKILDQAALNNCSSITFTGGEPVINKDALSFAIDFCNKLTVKPDLIIVTNGSLLDTELLETIRAYRGSIRVNLSFHSFKEGIFNKITQTEGNFEKTLKGMELLRQSEIDFRLNCVVLKGVNDSENDFQKIIADSLKKKIKRVTFLELLVTEQNKELQKYFISYNNIKTRLNKVSQNIGKLILEFENNKKIRYMLTIAGQSISLEIFKLTCRSGCQNCINIRNRTIGPDGEYYPCFIQSNTKCGVVAENMAEAFLEGDEVIKKNAEKYGSDSPIIV